MRLSFFKLFSKIIQETGNKWPLFQIKIKLICHYGNDPTWKECFYFGSLFVHIHWKLSQLFGQGICLLFSCNTKFLSSTASFTIHLVNNLLKKQRIKCKNHYFIMSFTISVLSNFLVCTIECFISFQRCANLFPHSSHA